MDVFYFSKHVSLKSQVKRSLGAVWAVTGAREGFGGLGRQMSTRMTASPNLRVLSLCMRHQTQVSPQWLVT